MEETTEPSGLDLFLEDEEDQHSEECSTDELDFVMETYRYLPVAH